MSDVKLPKIEVQINDTDATADLGMNRNNQIAESCILAYLGQRGYAGYIDKPINEPLTIKKMQYHSSHITTFSKATMPISRKNTFIQ